MNRLFFHILSNAAPFDLCSLGEDETAIAILLKKMGDYVRGEGDEPYPLQNA